MKPEKIAASFLNGSHKDHIKSWRIAYNGVALPQRYETMDDAMDQLPNDPCYTLVSPTGIRFSFASVLQLYV